LAAYVQAPDNGAIFNVLKAELGSIRSLSGKGLASINVISKSDPNPRRSYCYGAASNTTVWLEMQGDVDIDEEVKKVQAKMKKASDSAAKQQKLVSADDFQSKVSPAVQEIEKEKLEEMHAQIRNYEKSIEMFYTLKLDN
jgi:valyl-tRNA synthetase